MKRIALIIKNDLKRRAKSPVAVLVFLLIPLVMTGIIGMIFAPSKGSTKLPPIKVLVADIDKNFASKVLMGSFDAKEMKEMFQVTIVEEAEGKKLISKGKASALIIIPEKFTSHILKAEKTQVLVIKNPSEEFLPGIVEEFMNTISIILSGFVQVFEMELKGIDSLMNTPVENVSITEMTPFMEIAKKKLVALKTYISPLLIQLKQEAADKIEKKKDTGFNIFSFILPGMAVMFLLFIVEAFVREILTERENGITRRMMFSPLHAGQLVIARIFGGWIMGILVLLVMVVCGAVIFGIHWGNYFFLFILAAVAAFWCASFFAILNSFFKNKNQSAAFTSPIIMVFSAFGGSILPLSQIPSPMRWISGFTVNHWFISGAEKIGSGSFPAVSILILLASGLVLFLFAIFSLERRITV